MLSTYCIFKKYIHVFKVPIEAVFAHGNVSRSLHHDIAEFTPPVKNVGSVMNAYIVCTGEICHV